MDATRIIAIRHGETAWNVDSRLQGHLDIPLNDVGLWQARQAALALADEPIDAIYSRPATRLGHGPGHRRNHTGAAGRPPGPA